MTRQLFAGMLALLFAPVAAYGDAEPAPRVEKSVYDTLEVARFGVNREDYSTKEAERAGKIPEETLDHLQRSLLGELTRSRVLPNVHKAAEGEDSSPGALLLAGRVTDFKAGSRVARYFAGVGIGAQKVEVECVLKDKATGVVLGRETIVDRKWAGWAGGSEEKGIEDFAEKVSAFVQRTLEAPGRSEPVPEKPEKQNEATPESEED